MKSSSGAHDSDVSTFMKPETPLQIGPVSFGAARKVPQSIRASSRRRSPTGPVCSLSACRSSRSADRMPPFHAFPEATALPSRVLGPVDRSHGRQRRIASLCRALRSVVHPFANSVSYTSHSLTSSGIRSNIRCAKMDASAPKCSLRWQLGHRATALLGRSLPASASCLR
jgi:hypothetical protein